MRRVWLGCRTVTRSAFGIAPIIGHPHMCGESAVNLLREVERADSLRGSSTHYAARRSGALARPSLSLILPGTRGGEGGATASRAKQREIRSKPLRFLSSRAGKQVITGQRWRMDGDFRHQRAPGEALQRYEFLICSRQGHRLPGWRECAALGAVLRDVPSLRRGSPRNERIFLMAFKKNAPLRRLTKASKNSRRSLVPATKAWPRSPFRHC